MGESVSKNAICHIKVCRCDEVLLRSDIFGVKNAVADGAGGGPGFAKQGAERVL